MKIRYQTLIKKFSEMGEKTGWTYIEIPAEVAQKIFPNNKKSFRVKGKLDAYEFSGVSLLPMGEGLFIMALKADVRKKIKKIHGANLQVEIEHDKTEYQLDADFVECLEDDFLAKKYFYSLPKSHQKYFSKWIESAKTNITKEKRILKVVKALARKMNFAEMLREKTNE
jgi:Domain of unknown function (DUF1905)/Bacteriocin-protection, YdeI or OmpD-Associated